MTQRMRVEKSREINKKNGVNSRVQYHVCIASWNIALFPELRVGSFAWIYGRSPTPRLGGHTQPNGLDNMARCQSYRSAAIKTINVCRARPVYYQLSKICFLAILLFLEVVSEDKSCTSVLRAYSERRIKSNRSLFKFDFLHSMESLREKRCSAPFLSADGRVSRNLNLK